MPHTHTVSEKQLEANRRNAQISTGPRTAEGKARSSRNSLVHGLRSETWARAPGVAMSGTDPQSGSRDAARRGRAQISFRA